MSAAVEALGERLGVAAVHEDAWGHVCEASEAAKLGILAALGHPLTPGREEEEAAAQLESLHAADAAQVLPPVLVVELGAALALTPRLPAERAGQALYWSIACEDGGERNGRARLERAAAAGCAKPAAAGPCSLALAIAPALPPGRHRLSLFEAAAPRQRLAEAVLFVCPTRCFLPAAVPPERLWGPAVQVYALRSARDWGIGDFGTLRRLVDLAADAGAHFVGVNPLHARFPHAPGRASPYSPSSREWLDVLYLDIEAMGDFGECQAARQRVGTEAFGMRLEALRSRPLIDYPGVAAAKFEVLALLHRHFRSVHLANETYRAGLFRAFQREGGRSLRLHALFDALSAYFQALGAAPGTWLAWPPAFHDPDGAAVARFAVEHEEQVEFFEYLQWQAELQLQAVVRRMAARGMRLGLYRDLAVGVGEGGSESWARQHLFARGAHAGAPPDAFNPLGQDWGFPPVIPQRLVEDLYEGFLAVLRANLRHAGALRIDHVMSLMRLYWLPAGAAPAGAYVAYPMADLFRLVCLESRRAGCLIIGEDLGLVPPAVRQAMARHDLLSCRPLYFERPEGEVHFRLPGQWPQRALAVVGTHDLPTLAGYWSGADLQLREALGLQGSAEQQARQAAHRAAERAALLRTLAGEGLYYAAPEEEGGAPSPGLVAGVYRFIARTPARMVALQLEDVLGQVEAVNLPGSSEALHPNWRRRLSAELVELAGDPRWQQLAAALNAERGAPPRTGSSGPPGFCPQDADIPRATYRLQFHSGFGFVEAAAILPHLAALGVSHVYAAPFLKARPGSRHGYDIVDHQALNPELGSPADFDHYCARLAALGLGQVLDVVPNHVGVLGGGNAWWLDVLEDGPASRYAACFDIDWVPPWPALHGKLLLPVLGDEYGRVLETGDLVLAFAPERGEFGLRYFEHRFPVDPADYPAILAAASKAGLPAELNKLLAGLRRLPRRDVAAEAQKERRRRDKAMLKRQLAGLHALPAVQAHVGACLAALNGCPGEPASFAPLDALLSRQAYRLTSWRVAAEEINYRRFFDINALAALRMEHEFVFEATHALLFGWIAEGRASGLRIDHPDGLADPAAYFARLQRRCADLRPSAAPPGTAPPALYLVVEKILGDGEALPADWPVHGETGYHFANLGHQLFVDARQEARFSRLYRSFGGDAAPFGEVLREAKQLIMTQVLPGELARLARLLHEIARRERGSRDFTPGRLRGALGEFVTSFPVYRSYIDARGVSAGDRRRVGEAVEEAAARDPRGDLPALHFVRDALLSAPAEPDDELRRLKLGFTCRLQQYTAPVMAKAMEDTAFYRYNRLVSLNDVGGEPRRFGIEGEDFHAASERATPFGLLATSTHDSKRSEDLRARLDVLSEMPGAWRLALQRWRRANARHRTRVGDAPAPAPGDEYLLYQTLLGVWPMSPPDPAGRAALADRVEAYMQKAVREAQQHSSWIKPALAYEAALATFVRRLLAADPQADPFLVDFLGFQATLSRFGVYNSLNLQLLKLGVPGVPDIYQGCESWNFSLVDPDNRRVVDFDALRENLQALQRDFSPGREAAGLRRMLAAPADGRIKLYLLWRGLAMRQAFADVFREGRYQPLDVAGPAARHVLAFARVLGTEVVIVVATRLLFSLCGGDAAQLGASHLWARTRIALPWRGEACGWRDAFGGQRVPGGAGRQAWIEVAPLFALLPLALLVPDRGTA